MINDVIMTEPFPMNMNNYSDRQQFYTDEIPYALLAQLDLTEWQNCLEIGCGDGSLLAALESAGIFDHKLVLAIDVDKDRLDVVKHSTKLADCVVGDACEIAVKDQSVDFVITSQVIEHVTDDALMAQEIYRVLKDDGIAYISTVFKKWYGWYFYRCNGKWTLDPTHVREYTKESQLIEKLVSAGLKISMESKVQDGRPVMDSILRRIGAPRDIYNNKFLKALRSVRVPIPGYYIWEIVCYRPST